MNNPFAGYTTRDQWIERPGGRIYGQLFVPKDATAPLPVVICSHFFGGTHRNSAEWARLMAASGLVAYAFDYCGSTLASHSTGVSTLEMSIKTEAQDLSCVHDAIRALPEVDSAHVYLLGQSQGGAVSAMVADERPADIAGLFLLYPAFVIHDEMCARFGSPSEVPETFSHWQTLGRAYAVDAMAYDHYEHMGYTGPVHIWHGDRDGIVPLAYAERAARTYPSATLEVVRGAGHGFYERDQRRIAQAISESIKHGN